jgi:hypothetical protein
MIGDLVFGEVLVVVKNERGALPLGDLQQSLGDYFSLLDIGAATFCRWTRSESL